MAYRVLFAALLTAASVLAQTIPQAEFQQRRAGLRKKLEGTLVLIGYREGADDVYAHGQLTDVAYLTGWSQPGAAFILSPDGETVFLPHRNARREIYNGKRLAAEDADAKSVSGFAAVEASERFEAAVLKAVEGRTDVYAIGEPSAVAKLRALLPMREVKDGGPVVAALRMKKSAAEIAAIQHATDVSMDAHRASWRRVVPGAAEYNAAATFIATSMEAGCEGQAYEPIFGSGPNSTTLHYSANSRRMDQGETLVIDAAAKCGGYTSDITRTLPVGGKFTPRQRELYDLVLAAQQAAIDAIKPGILLADLTRIARESLDKVKDAQGNGMSKYLPHGISHHVGLDVHDASLPVKLEAGMVITVEPGLYIPAENIGIRIEDTVLVTEKGATLLSGSLPRIAAEIEKALAR